MLDPLESDWGTSPDAQAGLRRLMAQAGAPASRPRPMTAADLVKMRQAQKAGS